MKSDGDEEEMHGSAMWKVTRMLAIHQRRASQSRRSETTTFVILWLSSVDIQVLGNQAVFEAETCKTNKTDASACDAKAGRVSDEWHGRS